MLPSSDTLQPIPITGAPSPGPRTGRLQNVDLLKGILVLLVIVAHALSGDPNGDLFKYVTVIFRMPLLIGLSGYMFSYVKMQDYSFTGVCKKYKNRLIIPWTLAVLFFTVFLNMTKVHSFDIRSIGGIVVNGFLFPFSHLWYIVGLLAWIFLTWAFSKLQIKLFHLVVVSALLSPVLLLFHNGTFETHNPILKFIFYSIRPYYYFFFILGVYLKSTNKLSYTTQWHRLAVLTLAIMLSLVFFYYNAYIYAVLVVIFNTFLLMFVLDMAKGNRLFSNKQLEWAGRNSLAVYLWHPIPILILVSIIGRDKPLLFYSLSFITEIVLLYSIFYLSRFNFIRNHFFGLK
jgi:acyltransferase